MKNSLFIFAGLLLVIWAIVFYGFGSKSYINMLIPLAIFTILVRLVLSKQLSSKKN